MLRPEELATRQREQTQDRKHSADITALRELDMKDSRGEGSAQTAYSSRLSRRPVPTQPAATCAVQRRAKASQQSWASGCPPSAAVGLGGRAADRFDAGAVAQQDAGAAQTGIDAKLAVVAPPPPA